MHSSSMGGRLGFPWFLNMWLHAFLILEFQWEKVKLGCILTGLPLVVLTRREHECSSHMCLFFIYLLHALPMVGAPHGCILLDLGEHECRYNRERNNASQRLAWMRDALPLLNEANSYGNLRRVYVTNSCIPEASFRSMAIRTSATTSCPKWFL